MLAAIDRAGACSFGDLLAAGFTRSEIAEHGPEIAADHGLTFTLPDLERYRGRSIPSGLRAEPDRPDGERETHP